MLFGRDAERAEIGTLLKAARDSRSGALVLRGEPGIGKTALLEDARDRAADMHVLSVRGVESESELPYAALDQLLRPALGRLEQLPTPQASALRGALGLEDGAADQRFLVFAGCLSLLSELAERRPVLCLVDDAHWLDAASADALLFVARRLRAEGIVMLFAAREGDLGGFEAADIPSLTLEGLDAEAAERLLSKVAAAAAPIVRDRLIAQTHGNALALLELPSALNEAQLAGDQPLPEALPLTHRVESVFLGRVRRLPEETQRALLLAAADDAGDVVLVTRAAELLGVDRNALDPAEQAGLVIVHGNRLEFRHPLVRSAVYGAATSTECRNAHRVLADALEHHEDADRRAWHLAASVLEPDEDVVRALEDAATRAEQRGGYPAAAKALARAAELSAEGTARGRLLVGAARAARIGGADDDAVDLANQALPLVDDPLLRAEIACAIGAAGVRRGRPLEGLPTLIATAREVASLDPHKALELIIWAAAAAWTGGDRAAIAEVSPIVEAVAAAGGDDESVCVAQALSAFARAMEGDPTGGDGLEEAFLWASTSNNAQLVFWVSVALSLMGDDRRFATLIDRAVSLARAGGEFGILAEALSTRAIRHATAQRFNEATREAAESVRLARELGYTNVATRSLTILAYTAAIRGEEEETRRYADEALDLAAAHGLAPSIGLGLYALAMLDLGRGRWAEALERLQILADPRRAGNPLLTRRALPDTIEAAVRAGQLDIAQRALTALEEGSGNASPTSIRPRVASCRALMAEGDEAIAHFEEALASLTAEWPFDAARVQLLYGEHLRRRHRRTESRLQLRAAMEAFERFRAEPWAERARSELRASGETTRKRDPSTIDQLTPQEIQIAGMVAEGLTNKEVAAQLFLSPRTIDYHLRSVFVKLGITSRTQLARLTLGEKEEAAGRSGAAASA